MNLVELAEWDVVNGFPCIAAVITDRNAAVLSVPPALRIFLTEPERVKVNVSAARNLTKRLASINRSEQARSDRVDMILVRRIDAHAGVIKPTGDDVSVLRLEFERLTAIVGAIKRSVFGFNNHVNDVRITGRDANADAAHQFR